MPQDVGVSGSSSDEGAVASLISGVDYPASWRDFMAWFPDETAWLGFLERLRWPAGFACPKCGRRGEPWRQSRGRLVCRTCRHQTTVTAGTIFEKTRTPIRVWSATARQLSTAKNGLSAMTLAHTLGVHYRMAWAMLRRFRVAMVRAEREPLSGDVEVDETFVGGGHRPSRDRRVPDPTKALVGRPCLCSCIRTRLLNFGRLGDHSRETRPCLPGRSAEVVEVVALEQVVHGPGIVLVDDPVGDELPE